MLLLDANVSIGMLLRLAELPEGRSLICTLADAPLEIMLYRQRIRAGVSAGPGWVLRGVRQRTEDSP